MPGLYDNETGRYIFEQEVDDGQWFIDGDDLLYIIPSDPTMELIAPDTDTADEICRLLRQQEALTDDDIDSLGLLRIYGWQHRFNEYDGWYYA